MRGAGGGDCLRGLVRRHMETCEAEGWSDDEAHLRDLLALVNRTMCHDRNPARATSWWKLRRAIEDALLTP